MALEIVEEYELSIFRACKLMEIHCSYSYYQEERDDTEVEEAIRTAAQYDMVPGLCGRCPAYIERFNGSYRRAVLDAYIFRSIENVKRLTQEWNCCYNHESLQESLDNMPPIEYRAKRCDT